MKSTPKKKKPKSSQLHYVCDSFVEMTQLVLPNETNLLGNLLGGRLMEWMDIAAGISAQRHARRVCVTAEVDKLVFHHPIRLGEVVILRAVVNRVFGSSMEVGVEVTTENQLSGEKKIANTAYLTFVALDENGKPVKVDPIIPRTSTEKQRHRDALKRRMVRLQRNTQENG